MYVFHCLCLSGCKEMGSKVALNSSVEQSLHWEANSVLNQEILSFSKNNCTVVHSNISDSRNFAPHSSESVYKFFLPYLSDIQIMFIDIANSLFFLCVTYEIHLCYPPYSFT